MLKCCISDDDLPPPPPELIDEEEPSRPSFGSSGPGVQSRTFRHLQEAVESGEGKAIAQTLF